MDLIVETYDGIEAAIGWTATEGCEVVAGGKTSNLGLILQGYTETRYAIDVAGTKWTVHRNPDTGLYTGAHRSGGRRAGAHRRRR